jgi:hypothetical protein
MVKANLRFEHAVTKAMVQLTFVPSLKVFKHFFMLLNNHFSQNVHAVKG